MGNEKLLWNCNILNVLYFLILRQSPGRYSCETSRFEFNCQTTIDFRLKVGVPNFSVVYFYGYVSKFQETLQNLLVKLLVHFRWENFPELNLKCLKKTCRTYWLMDEILHQLYNMLIISQVLQDFFQQQYLSLAPFPVVANEGLVRDSLDQMSKKHPQWWRLHPWEVGPHPRHILISGENGGHIPITTKLTPLFKKDPILPC